MWFIHTCKIWISHFTDTLDFYWSADRVCDSVYINLLHVELNDSVSALTSDVIRWTHSSVSVGWWYWPELYYSVIRLSISREVSTESRSGLWAAVRSVGTNVYGKPQHQNTQSSTGHRWTGNKSTIIRALILDPQLCVCNFCWGCEDVSFNSESVQTHESSWSNLHHYNWWTCKPSETDLSSSTGAVWWLRGCWCHNSGVWWKGKKLS